MVSEAIVMCVRTSPTITRPHQGRPSKQLNSIRAFVLTSTVDGRSGFYANLHHLYLQIRSTSCTSTQLFAVIALQHPNLPLRNGNFDSPRGEFRQQFDTDIRAYVQAATLRILDPETEFQIHAALGELQYLRR